MARKASLAPNLAVIAQKLGISRSTACRALRNANDVGLETRLRVVQTARELGYVVPQRSGPADAPKGHQVMVLSQCGEYGPDQGYMAGMSRSSIPLNLVLLTHHLSGDECMKIVEAENQPVAMQQGMVDGLVFLHRWPTEVVAKLSAKTPSVSVIHYYSQGNGDFVGIDNRFGMELIVNHLVRGGHRKIGFFGLYDQMSWARSRYCGFIEALRMAGLPFVPESVLEMEQSGQIPNEEYPDNGWKEKVLARMKTGVDAWVCSSEGIGWELCRFLLSRGCRRDRISSQIHAGAQGSAHADNDRNPRRGTRSGRPPDVGTPVRIPAGSKAIAAAGAIPCHHGKHPPGNGNSSGAHVARRLRSVGALGRFKDNRQ